ncbi:UDP-N-acetylmuramate dehydrogenase [Candidatus Gottesmanbacteria bacterium]|nr:UDP-N-acetylmuramate dehydrogenase [Candidatus Gottesmanbacteria bacterium]
MQELKKILGERVKENETLARYTTFKIGGPADLLYEAKTVDELVAAVTAARKLSIPIFLLGGGSNILIGDKGIRGLVIKNSTNTILMRGAKGSYKSGQTTGKVYVEADSGVLINKLVRDTIDEGLGGLEMHLGLPGTVGGAMFMNSKWTKPETYVGDVVYQATILTSSGEIKTVPKEYFHFGYDESAIQHSGDIVLGVVFVLNQKPKEQLWEEANGVVAYRKETQPQGVFSPGCTFRNISKADAIAAATPEHTTSAGYLVDHAGLKGTSVGEAYISQDHANFIVNRGHATAADVVTLIELARSRVKEQFGVELVEEIVRIGEF